MNKPLVIGREGTPRHPPRGSQGSVRVSGRGSSCATPPGFSLSALNRRNVEVAEREPVRFSPDAEEWFALLFGMERVRERMAELEGARS